MANDHAGWELLAKAPMVTTDKTATQFLNIRRFKYKRVISNMTYIRNCSIKKLPLNQSVRHKGDTIRNPESFELRVEHPLSEKKKQNH